MTITNSPITGGCLCRALRWESSEAPSDGGYCHCRNCQKAYGGIFFPWLIFVWRSFRFTQGNLHYYRSAPIAQRGFCRDCGSPVVHRYDDQSFVSVPVGTLDYPGDWSLNRENWCGHVFLESKVGWHELTDDLPQHQRSAKYADKAYSDESKK